MERLPPRSTRTDTLFPYTTLFRSVPPLREIVGFNDVFVIGVSGALDAGIGRDEHDRVNVSNCRNSVPFEPESQRFAVSASLVHWRGDGGRGFAIPDRPVAMLIAAEPAREVFGFENPGGAWLVRSEEESGRAACRERVCKYV